MGDKMTDKNKNIESDTYYCENCGIVNNVSKVGKLTCLECGDIIENR
jgi:hypothetical protein